jgi:hypothetical protein
MTLAIAHLEGDAAGTKRAVVDLIREARPPPRQALKFTQKASNKLFAR